MSTANVEGMVREASRMIGAGELEAASTLLLKAVEMDQYNEEAWLMLAKIVESDEEKSTCLENVLVINPANTEAQALLRKVKGEEEEPPAPPVRSQANLFDDFDFDDPSGSTSVFSTEDSLSDDDLDKWFEELPAVPAQSSTPLIDDSVFADSTFTSEVPRNNSDEPFSATELTEMPAVSPTSPPRETKTILDTADFAIFEEDFEETSSATSSASYGQAFEAPSQSGGYGSRSIEVDDFGTDFGDDDEYLEDDFADFAEEYDNYTDEFRDLGVDDPFALIPASVKPTRLPGTPKKSSGGGMVGVIVLALLNLTAAAALVYGFIA